MPQINIEIDKDFIRENAQQMGLLSATEVQTYSEPEKAVAQRNIFNRYTPVGADFENLFIGENSGNETMTTSVAPDTYRGSSNLGIGNGTLLSTTIGYRNTAIGTDCMTLLTTGYHNTGCGHGVLQRITTGSYNSGYGIGSLLDITTGSNNSGYGGDTLFRTTTGSRNSALGRNALFENLTGDDNCAFGYNALFLNTAGYGNSAFGGESLADCTVGFRNSAFGIAALRLLTTGYHNTAIGDNAGATITTGNTNTMIGLNAGSGLTTGSNNVVIGAATMNAADAGHVVIADGLGNRRLSFDASGVGTFPGIVAFDTVTRFGAPLRDASNANRIEIPVGGNTTLTSGGNFITGLDVGGNEIYRIDYYRAFFLGGVVFRPQVSETLSGNGQMAFELVSDTSLRIKVRGSDGTSRTVLLTLA